MANRCCNPEISVFEDLRGLSVAAARVVVGAAEEAVKQRGMFALALSGGSTPRALYDLLASEQWREQVPWEKTQVFWGDERCVPPEHEESNFRLASEHLISRVGIPRENVHRMRGEIEPKQAAAEYEAQMLEILGAEPALDLALLGMGPDGHTASLFPGTEALGERERWVVANHVPRLDSWRITMTCRALNAARMVLLLVSGEGKAELIARAVALSQGGGAPAAADVPPVALVSPVGGELIWMLDQDAAGDAL